MDVNTIVSDLHSELDEINREIQTLERTDSGTNERTARSVSQPDPGTGRRFVVGGDRRPLPVVCTFLTARAHVSPGEETCG